MLLNQIIIGLDNGLLPIAHQLDPYLQISVKFELKYNFFHSWKWIWKSRLWNGDHFVQGGVEMQAEPSWVIADIFSWGKPPSSPV